MKVHFVCTSNTFRSRLAEAYLKSKKIKDLTVTSSGVIALSNPNGPVSWYGQKIIQEQDLVQFEKMLWTQTTKEILENQDLVIFMTKAHYDHSVSEFKFKGDKFAVWEIEDLVLGKDETTNDAIQKTEEIYNRIRVNIEDLISTNFQVHSS